LKSGKKGERKSRKKENDPAESVKARKAAQKGGVILLMKAYTQTRAFSWTLIMITSKSLHRLE
jgi:hypothetical protein